MSGSFGPSYNYFIAPCIHDDFIASFGFIESHTFGTDSREDSFFGHDLFSDWV